MARLHQDDTAIHYNKDGEFTGAHGRDAMQWFGVACLRREIRLLKVGIKPHRGYTWKLAYATAKRITGKDYKGPKDADRCLNDLHIWFEAMRAALPVEQTK